MPLWAMILSSKKMLPNLLVTNFTHEVMVLVEDKQRLGIVGKIESINDSTAQPFEVLNGG
jgi:16S rRNA processing protein RimM